jgi:hypothetical protein
MSKVTELERDLHDTTAMLSRIGEPQPHFRDGSVGRLHCVECKVTIHHQRSTGDTNYHTLQAFNVALAKVVSRRFTELSTETIAELRRALDEAIVGEESKLKERLESVAAAKARLASGE